MTTYIYDGLTNNIIPDEPVRKPNAVPPKTKTIKKLKDGSKPKYRKENLSERVQRIQYEVDGNVPKPPHYDNPFIVDDENFKKPPKPFNNADKSTYPSDRLQRQRLNTWELVKEDAKGDPEKMKEVRRILKDSYKTNPNILSDSELKMIGKFKSKSKAPILDNPLLIKPIVKTEPKPVEPQIPLEQIIKQNADKRLAQEQKEYEKFFGKGGITELLKPWVK